MLFNVFKHIKLDEKVKPPGLSVLAKTVVFQMVRQNCRGFHSVDSGFASEVFDGQV